MRRNVPRLQRFGEICLDALVNAHPYWRESAPESNWYDLAPKQYRHDLFVSQGRLSQDDFISYSIFRIALSVVLTVYLTLVPVGAIFGLMFVLFWEAIWLRVYLWRLHDIGHSGKLLLPILALLPLIQEGISIYQRFALLNQLTSGQVPSDLGGIFSLFRTPQILAQITYLLLFFQLLAWLYLILRKGYTGANAYGEEPITDREEASSSTPPSSKS